MSLDALHRRCVSRKRQKGRWACLSADISSLFWRHDLGVTDLMSYYMISLNQGPVSDALCKSQLYVFIVRTSQEPLCTRQPRDDYFLTRPLSEERRSASHNLCSNSTAASSREVRTSKARGSRTVGRYLVRLPNIWRKGKVYFTVPPWYRSTRNEQIGHEQTGIKAFQPSGNA
jgi:hypothetical protein